MEAREAISLGALDYMQAPAVATVGDETTELDIVVGPPSFEDEAWENGYQAGLEAGRAESEQHIRDLELTIGRLEVYLHDARTELMSRGR